MSTHGSTSRFDHAMVGAIVANTGVLGWSWLDHAHPLTLERMDTCFVVFFLIELVARLRRAGWRWLRRPWNLFDATIILLALLPVVGDGITILRMARVAKLVHLGQHISHLRAAAWHAGASAQQAHRSGEDRGACADMMLAPLERMDGLSTTPARGDSRALQLASRPSARCDQTASEAHLRCHGNPGSSDSLISRFNY